MPDETPVQASRRLERLSTIGALAIAALDAANAATEDKADPSVVAAYFDLSCRALAAMAQDAGGLDGGRDPETAALYAQTRATIRRLTRPETEAAAAPVILRSMRRDALALALAAEGVIRVEDACDAGDAP